MKTNKFIIIIVLVVAVFFGYRWYRRATAPPPPPPPPSIEQTITTIEGWTVEEIAEYLRDAIGMPVTAFEKAAFAYPKSPAGKSFFGGGRIQSVEGYLFPDTYRVYKKATALDVVEKMLANFDARVTADIRAKIRAQRLTLHEGVTLASIIEQEVATPEDRRVVADIFLKRLKAGIALQADSTVNYITKKGMSRATIVDTKIDSPYNTYRYRGLPPGPISNPGLDAILAVAEPTLSPYLYFLTTEDGRVIYARDFEEHKQNRQRYLH
ncbi:endolytic transglycosylase MltG [Candidatus Uhrbacteria bacterium]|nr:endolytic transglycosylase MltG [Candidatus Uhrbacteria bacterium]